MAALARSDELDQILVTELRMAVTKLSRWQRHEAMRQENLPHSLMTALSSLQRIGPMSPSDLAEVEGVRKPVMTRALAKLGRDGFVVRSPDPSDGRQVIIELTATGSAALEKARAAINEWYFARLECLDADEIEALRAAVGPFSKLANADSMES
jgi:DNA-binding MarR family transcriptional regulator